jgi:hypothetical protein
MSRELDEYMGTYFMNPGIHGTVSEKMGLTRGQGVRMGLGIT